MAEEYFINEEQTKDGLKKKIKTVKRLVGDSKLCIDNGRYALCASSSILAMEECAKADFFRLKVREGKGITKKEWIDLTAGGRSHINKLSWFLDKKEQRMEKWTQKDIQLLNYISTTLGFGGKDENKDQMSQEIKFLRTLIPKFNVIKQSCFYTNWNNKKWVYFDNMFSDKLKFLITTLLYLEAKKEYLSLLFIQELPKKTFVEYTKSDWEQAVNSKSRKELADLYIVINKKLGNNYTIVTKAISSIN